MHYGRSGYLWHEINFFFYFENYLPNDTAGCTTEDFSLNGTDTKFSRTIKHNNFE
jgi:hypothetical protein